jgi:hypothetical protein
MTAGEAPVSSRIALIGIALIWMTAQVLVVVAHDFWASRAAHRNTFEEWCCRDDNCEMRGPVAVTSKGWLIGSTVFVPARTATPYRDAKT